MNCQYISIFPSNQVKNGANGLLRIGDSGNVIHTEKVKSWVHLRNIFTCEIFLMRLI